MLLALAVAGAWSWLREPESSAQATVALRRAAQSPTGAPCSQPLTAEPAPQPPAALSGRLGLWVARVDPATLQPIRAVAVEPDGLFPLASSYKQAVLWALLRDIDAGKVALSETFDVTLANQSLGNYPFDDSTVETLATRMIQKSDNTATDILHRRVGLGKVQAIADGLGLCQTRLILPTKTWWIAQAGLDDTWPGAKVFGAATGKELDDLARKLDETAQRYRADYLQRQLDVYFEERYDPEIDLGTQNVSTPYEFGQLIAHQFLRPNLTGPSRAMLRDVMATGYGRSKLRVPVRYFGGKGGNGWKILTMTGYFETSAGDHVVYVFMQHRSHEDYTIPNTGSAFQWINAAVEQVLRDPAPVAQVSKSAP